MNINDEQKKKKKEDMKENMKDKDYKEIFNTSERMQRFL